MEISRKIYQELEKWRIQTNGKKALLIEGARRVEKSTTVEKYAKEHYRSYILIEFNEAPKNIKLLRNR